MELRRVGGTVEAFVEGLPAGPRATARELRALVARAAPHLEETVRWALPIYRGRADVAALLVYDEEVHLAFFEGTRLNVEGAMLERTRITEAAYLLQGVGDRVRFLRFKAGQGVDGQTVVALVRQAVAFDGQVG